MVPKPDFLARIARSIARPSQDAPAGVVGSILTVAAGSYGFSPTNVDATMPSGFDPMAAALFESILEAAYLVATADGVFDQAEHHAFRTVIFHACGGVISDGQLQALLSDLGTQFREDGIDRRVEMVARTVKRTPHQAEVLRIAGLLAHVSGGVSASERLVLEKLALAMGVMDRLDGILQEVRDTIAEANAT